MFYGIGSEDTLDDLIGFRDQFNIEFPILFDQGRTVMDQYNQQMAFPSTRYPQDWIIGADGRVKYVGNTYDPEQMAAILDEELAK